MKRPLLALIDIVDELLVILVRNSGSSAQKDIWRLSEELFEIRVRIEDGDGEEE